MFSKFDTNPQSDELTAADLYDAQGEWEAEQYEEELSDFDPHRDFYAEIDVIITTGGTGLTGRDITPEAIEQIADKQIPGFGEIFRNISLKTVGTSAIQSRACAVLANGKYVFALPGSSIAKVYWSQCRILRAPLLLRLAQRVVHSRQLS